MAWLVEIVPRGRQGPIIQAMIYLLVDWGRHRCGHWSADCASSHKQHNQCIIYILRGLRELTKVEINYVSNWNAPGKTAVKNMYKAKSFWKDIQIILQYELMVILIYIHFIYISYTFQF